MTIKKFTKGYIGASSEALKEKQIKSLKIKKRIPVAEKAKLIEALCKVILDEGEAGYKYDSIVKYVSFMVYSVSFYTGLEIGDISEDYDSLTESKAIEAIFTEIAEDHEEFTMLFNMRFDDYIRDKNSLVSIVGTKLSEIGFSIDVAVSNLVKSLDKDTIMSLVSK